MSAASELAEAVRGILPYLRASFDAPEPQHAMMMSRGMGLRIAADRAEHEDAAIYRLRSALAAYEEAKSDG